MSAALDLARRAIIAVAAVQSALLQGAAAPRYRLARVWLHTSPQPALDRFAHLRRSYD